MTYYIPAGSGQIVHHIALTGDPEEMAVTLGWISDLSVIDLDAVANGVHDAFTTLWAARGSDQYTVNHTTVTLVTVTGEEPLIADHVEAVAGGQASNVLPQNTAMLIHKNTGLGGRYNKGRMYFPGAFESQVSNVGLIDSTSQAAWNTALASLLTAYNAVSGVEAVGLLHNPRAADLTPGVTEITSLVIDPIVATQRRRLRP